MITHAAAELVLQQCVAVHDGKLDISDFAELIRHVLIGGGLWLTQAQRALIQLCQAN